ncbi:39750_t:CDS:1, partial [Gigaspora margarita]
IATCSNANFASDSGSGIVFSDASASASIDPCKTSKTCSVLLQLF